jgi:adenylylsulfate kinase
VAEQKATNITWHDAEITQEAREILLNQKGVVIWFTGLSGSGKSTLAHAVEEALYEKKHLTYVLDGDNIRHGLNKNLGFSPEDREENIRRIGEVAKLFTDAGVIAMTAFISPYCKDRDQARSLVKSGRFVEVYCACSLEACEERDPKGLYKKARAGEIKQFTGIDAPYEAPNNPEITVETDKLSLEESAKKVIAYLQDQNII